MKLGIREIVVPPAVGVASAAGFLVAPVSYDLVQTYKMPLYKADLAYLDALLESLRARAGETLAKAGSEAVWFEASFDVRYVGQGYEIKVALPEGSVERFGKEAWRARFDEAYRKLFGRALTANEFEIVNVRLIARGPDPDSPFQAYRRAGGKLLKGTRSAFCARARRHVEHSVCDRHALAPGVVTEGPALIEERETTTVVGDGWRAQVDDFGSLRLRAA